MKTLLSFLAISAIVTFLISCNSTDSVQYDVDVLSEESSVAKTYDFGANIYYKDLSRNNYAITLPFGEGEYSVAIGYLRCITFINPRQGGFYINDSESGLRYPITFKDTKGNIYQKAIVVSGISYEPDTLEVCSSQLVIFPFHNGQPGLNPPVGSRFDTPPQGVPSLISKGIVINPYNGSIDLKKTLSNGAFGNSPKSGDKISFRVYYRLNDESKYSLNYSDFVMSYYAPEDLQYEKSADSASKRLLYEPRCPVVVIDPKCMAQR